MISRRIDSIKDRPKGAYIISFINEFGTLHANNDLMKELVDLGTGYREVLNRQQHSPYKIRVGECKFRKVVLEACTSKYAYMSTSERVLNRIHTNIVREIKKLFPGTRIIMPRLGTDERTKDLIEELSQAGYIIYPYKFDYSKM